MSLALRKVAANASKSGCTIIFLNQLRYKVRGRVCAREALSCPSR